MNNHFNILAGVLLSTCIFAGASANAQSGLPASDSIRLNQLGFYPKAPKMAVVLTDHTQKFTIQSADYKTVFSGMLTPSAKPDLSGRTIYLADFSTLHQADRWTAGR